MNEWSLTDGVNTIQFFPELGTKENLHRTQTKFRAEDNTLYQYKHESHKQWEIGLSAVNSADRNQIRTWFNSDAIIDLAPGYDFSCTPVVISGTKRPLDQFMFPYEDLWQDTLSLVQPLNIACLSLTSMSYSGDRDLTSEDSGWRGITFSADGLRMYLIGATNDEVFSYTLSTAWDITSVTYDSLSSGDIMGASFLNRNGNIVALEISSDGTRIFLYDAIFDLVEQFTFGTPYDITTLSWDSGSSMDTSAASAATLGMSFKPDGTRFYMVALSGTDRIINYTLSTAWDLSTAVLAVGSLTIQDEGINPQTVAISKNGEYVFTIAGTGNKEMFAYRLTTPWDLSSGSYHEVSTSLTVSLTSDLFTADNAEHDIVYGVAAPGGGDGYGVWAYDLVFSR